MELPGNIAELETLCIEKGLACVVREGPDPRAFGNMCLLYQDSRLAVRIERDRHVWAVYVRPATGSNASWCDVGSLMELLQGDTHDILKIDEDIEFLETNWYVVVDLFAPENLQATQAKLDVLGTARLKRLYPHLRME
jgi:hypothetical protein